ncbi:glycine oxidase ThiO [Pseudochelatococcus contaminans]|uniref:Glycine oxidase n=1 Tax=Pseudochelatococcus contaminans TaxID=1538103 RepID=A0A7W5Z1N9_9HYPH|nr:glycine oxidase ThiO [Pseudochelatococcus contaminans]MBB3808433.1 glycine oxidase [Pseudochelatococcus contaminans]
MNTRVSESVIIVGAGVIGLSLAWLLARAGRPVVVFDKAEAGQGASHAAAGMLAACTELEPGEEWLLSLNRRSQQLWPTFAAELESASGIAVDLREEGTLHVALNADEQGKLRHHLALQEKADLPVEWLSPAEVRAREPFLANATGAIWSPQDHQVDNRKLAAALRVAAPRAGAVVHEHTPVDKIVVADGRITGIEAGGAFHPASVVVLAAGAWSRSIGGLTQETRPPVRPVKGQMLALSMPADAPLLRHVVWAAGIYLVPRVDGRLIVGATAEERGFDGSITAGGVLSLLQNAWRALPGIEELPLIETWTGFRPGSRDDAPILGEGPVEGLVYATGHHRNGILQTPVTADIVSRLILEGARDPLAEPYAFGRFK